MRARYPHYLCQMESEVYIRRAQQNDAEGIALVIQTALRESTSKDYAPAIIERVLKNFDAPNILALMQKRIVFTAFHEQRVVGTASLDQGTVRTVFVSPDMQRLGIGRSLMARVENAAIDAGIHTLTVPSSIGAVSFYGDLGYQVIKEEFYGAEKTIIMCRDLLS